MQRTGEMFGVRARVWLGAFAGAAILCALVGVTRQKPDSSTSARPHASIALSDPLGSKTNSPAPPIPAFPPNGFDSAFAKLLQQLSDPDVRVRLTAFESLEKLELPDHERVSLLTACLADSDPQIRAQAALRLGSFRLAAIDAVPTLKQLAQTEPDDVVRARVKDALYNIRMYDYSPFMRDL